MRFFVLTKKKLLAFGCCVLVGALAVMIGFQGAGAILQTVASPRKSPIYSVQREDKVVSLTFDTAWGNGQTEDILNILEQYEVKSTFFVTGDWAQEYPEMVKATRRMQLFRHTSPYASGRKGTAAGGNYRMQ